MRAHVMRNAVALLNISNLVCSLLSVWKKSKASSRETKCNLSKNEKKEAHLMTTAAVAATTTTTINNVVNVVNNLKGI